MKAAVLYASRDIRYVEVDTPSPGAGQVLIEVMASGICGSDLPRVNGDAAHYYPIILGHEFSGRVAEVGVGVDSGLIGRKATAAPLVPCMECADCQRGNYSLCGRYTFIGSRSPGSFADYVVVPARNIVPLSEEVSFTDGAFFEPSTVALHGLKRAGYRGGGRVAVLGMGTIGAFTLKWARLLGARKVVAFDINAGRLALAGRMGADALINTSGEGDYVAAALGEAGGSGFDFVLETAGRNETMSLAFKLSGNAASVCFIGTSSRDLSFDHKTFELMNRKEFTLTGSWMSYSAPFPGDEWSMTADYAARGLLTFEPELIDTKYHLSRAADAFERFRMPGGSVKGKIMLVNGGEERE